MFHFKTPRIMNFGHDVVTIAVEQFFGTSYGMGAAMKFDERRETYCRWSLLKDLLLLDDKISPLWGKRDFRLGYKMVLWIVSRLDIRDTDESQKREMDKFTSWDFIEHTVGSALEYDCDNPIETMNLLIEGAKSAIEKEDEDDSMTAEERVEIIKDLKVMLVLAKMVAEFKNTVARHKIELDAEILGEQKEEVKSKPLKEAA